MNENIKSTESESSGRKYKGSERDLLDMFIVLAQNKKKIIVIPLIFSIFVVGLSFLLPNKYVSGAKILPPQSQSSAAMLLGQLGALGGVIGSSGGASIKNPNDIYIGILSSRTIGEKLVDHFKLMDVYEKKYRSDARRQLASLTSIASGKDGMITVDVEDIDPERAAAIANAYVMELQLLNQKLAITEASQRRQMFETQLLDVKKNLANAEVELKIMQEKTGVIELTGQAQVIIKGAAEVKAKIAEKEIELRAMQTYSTDSNPDYIRQKEILSGLRNQLVKMETSINAGNGDISVPTNSVPEVALEYVRKLRDVKYYEAIFEVMAKQYELAKIDEAKNGSMIQVLDAAITPDKKSGPSRAIFLILAAIFCGFIMICYVLFKDICQRMGEDSKYKMRLETLRAGMRWK